MTIGTLAAIVAGCTMPVSTIFFGKMTDKLIPGPEADRMHVAREYLVIYSVLGIIGFFSSYIGVTSWMISGERQSINLELNILELF